MSIFEIGEILRTARRAQNYSQEEVALALGMSRSTISGIENGTITEIGIRKVLALCAHLGVELVAHKKSARPTLAELQQENNHRA